MGVGNGWTHDPIGKVGGQFGIHVHLGIGRLGCVHDGFEGSIYGGVS